MTNEHGEEPVVFSTEQVRAALATLDDSFGTTRELGTWLLDVGATPERASEMLPQIFQAVLSLEARIVRLEEAVRSGSTVLEWHPEGESDE